ncbi:MAG: LysE family translocator [Thermomicrobiales bacterium]
MVETSTFGTFLIAAFLLLVIPGPAVMYIVARGIHQGRLAGMVSALGVGAGSLVHVAAATVGLSALLVSSALAFSIVKYAGAAYLIYLGVRTLLQRAEVHRAAALEPARLGRIFVQGALVNVLNPKTALFFLAFLPQFVDPARGSATGQTLVYGVIFTVMGIGSDSAYGLLSGTLGGWLKRQARLFSGQRLVAGAVYLGLGLATAVADVRRK